jgi:hypothetical protein
VLTRRFRFTVDVVEEEVTLRVALTGFGNDPPNGPTGADPQLTWSIGGTTLRAPAMGRGTRPDRGGPQPSGAPV